MGTYKDLLLYKNQIRRSSRSSNICTIEVDMENSETHGWLAFSKACDYISKDVYDKLFALSNEIGIIVQYMIDNPGKFGAG
jgi:hypothetical protein